MTCDCEQVGIPFVLLDSLNSICLVIKKCLWTEKYVVLVGLIWNVPSVLQGELRCDIALVKFTAYIIPFPADQISIQCKFNSQISKGHDLLDLYYKGFTYKGAVLWNSLSSETNKLLV